MPENINTVKLANCKKIEVKTDTDRSARHGHARSEISYITLLSIIRVISFYTSYSTCHLMCIERKKKLRSWS